MNYCECCSSSVMLIAQSCLTLCNSMDYTAHGILQARILELAFPFPRGSSQPRDWTQVSPTAGRFFTDSEPQGKPKSTGVGESEVTQSCPTLCDPWTVAHQAPLSTGFARQEYWSGLPFPSPGDLPDPGIEPRSPTLQADALTSAPPGKPIGVGSLSLLQGIFMTQELNWGLLHFRQIIYQLSYQQNPGNVCM